MRRDGRRGSGRSAAAAPRVCRRIRSSVVASQVGLHQRYGGVVPEIASREHVRQVLPMIDEALRAAGVSLGDLGAVAVATRPGLVGALVVGLTAAKALALALEIPLVAVDHLEGHLYACQLAYPDREVYPCVGLVVSGGHTSLYLCQSPLECEFWAARPTTRPAKRSIRWQACSAWDIPAVRRSSERPEGGDPAAFAFPRSFLHDERLLLSFSGLKTAVLYALGGQNARQVPANLDPGLVRDVAASFQEAVVDVIVAKTRQALTRIRIKRLGVGGGVAANSRLRAEALGDGRRMGVEVFIPPPIALHRQRRHGRHRAAQARRRANRAASTSTSRPAWSGRDGSLMNDDEANVRSRRAAAPLGVGMMSGSSLFLERSAAARRAYARRSSACSCEAGIDAAVHSNG